MEEKKFRFSIRHIFVLIVFCSATITLIRPFALTSPRLEVLEINKSNFGAVYDCNLSNKGFFPIYYPISPDDSERAVVTEEFSDGEIQIRATRKTVWKRVTREGTNVSIGLDNEGRRSGIQIMDILGRKKIFWLVQPDE